MPRSNHSERDPDFMSRLVRWTDEAAPGSVSEASRITFSSRASVYRWMNGTPPHPLCKRVLCERMTKDGYPPKTPDPEEARTE